MVWFSLLFYPLRREFATRNFPHFRLHSGGVSARIAIDSIHYYKGGQYEKSVLRKYATLIATVGVNVQKGQEASSPPSSISPEFVKMVVEECYRAGAKRVVVDWDYQPLTKLHVRWRSQKNLHAGKLGGSLLAALCR